VEAAELRHHVPTTWGRGSIEPEPGADALYLGELPLTICARGPRVRMAPQHDSTVQAGVRQQYSLHSGHTLRVVNQRWMQSRWNTCPHVPRAHRKRLQPPLDC
jgi:hypothetical protein